jgi:hypothetical protein
MIKKRILTHGAPLSEVPLKDQQKSKLARSESKDPAEALRTGWRLHVDFGLDHAELYLLMYANPRPGRESHAAERAQSLLREQPDHE